MNKILITALGAVLFAGANAQFLMDQIGPDNTGQLTGTVAASQDFEAAFDQFDVIVIDDFTVAGPANITGVEAVMGMWNNAAINWANVTAFRIEIFSSTASATTSLTGNVASQSVAAGSATIDTGWIGGANIVSKVSMSGLNINIGAAGTYWIGVMGVMDFTNQGQVGTSTSTVGTGTNAFQANPGGGFALPGNGNPLNPAANAAYRVTGTVVPEPGTFIAIGLGLAGLALARRRK